MDPEAARHAITGTSQIADGTVILAATDGLESLVSEFHKYDSLEEVGMDILKRGSGVILSELREAAEEANSFDDASYFILRFSS